MGMAVHIDGTPVVHELSKMLGFWGGVEHSGFSKGQRQMNGENARSTWLWMDEPPPQATPRPRTSPLQYKG